MNAPPPPTPTPALLFHVSKCSAASAYLSHNQRFSTQCPKHPFHCRHTRGLVPATSPGDHAPRVRCPLLPKDQVAGTRICSLRLVPRNQSGLNSWDTSLRLVPGSSLFVCTVHGTSPRNQMKINHMVLSVCKTLRAHGVH